MVPFCSISDLAALRSDVQSRLWMTYRRNFAQIGDSNFTSDKGWGCMLRCGQMVLAEALIRRHLGIFFVPWASCCLSLFSYSSFLFVAFKFCFSTFFFHQVLSILLLSLSFSCFFLFQYIFFLFSYFSFGISFHLIFFFFVGFGEYCFVLFFRTISVRIKMKNDTSYIKDLMFIG